jgi:hypothetical protein
METRQKRSLLLPVNGETEWLITKPESMQNFTPFQSLTGGVIIGIGALLLLWRAERIAGITFTSV